MWAQRFHVLESPDLVSDVPFVDVVARDERGHEDFDHCHRPVRAFDPAHWLLRLSLSSLF